MAEQNPTASEPAGTKTAVQAGSPKSQTSNHRAVDISSETQNALAQDPLQADDNTEDDPAFAEGEGGTSYLSSLKSSVLHYKYQNGRRYHAFKDGAYLAPNDDEEQDRMDLAHHLYRMLLGGELHLAPIDSSVQRVLDLGTGTGIWCIDFADQYPSAHILGTDLSPIQPQWTPPNCTFEVDDFEQEWVYRQKFDYIHARELGGCLADDEQFFRRVYEHLEPGGYFEIQAVYTRFFSDDSSGDKAEDAHFWMTQMCEGTAKFGKPLDLAPTWAEKLKDVGFENVEQAVRKCPIGSWPRDPVLKEIGKVQAHQELQVIDSYTPAVFSRVLGWGEEEIEVLKTKVKNNLKDPAIHLYLPVYFIWGRKPAATAEA